MTLTLYKDEEELEMFDTMALDLVEEKEGEPIADQNDSPFF